MSSDFMESLGESMTPEFLEDSRRDVDLVQSERPSFPRARELGRRGAYVVLHPYTREHIDVVDFDIEIARRDAAGLGGYDYWSAPLPKVEK